MYMYSELEIAKQLHCSTICTIGTVILIIMEFGSYILHFHYYFAVTCILSEYVHMVIVATV